MTHGQFFVAHRARTDRQMRPRDCSAPLGSEADQQSSAELPLPGRCDSTPVANTRVSVLWQEQAPAIPADIGFASSATALRSFNDEIRMSNAFARYNGSPVSLPALPWVSYRRQTFSKLLLLALGFSLLISLARLLLRARTRRRTTDQYQKERRNQNRGGEQLLHTEIGTIIGAINAATSRQRCSTGRRSRIIQLS